MIKKFRTAAFFFVAVVLLLAACAVNKPDVRTPSAVLSHHTIGGKLFTSAWMQRSAEYQALCLQAYNIATERLDRAVDLNSRSEAPKKLAVITDIDETFLDNSPNSVHQALSGKDYEEASWNAWCELADADTVGGAVDFFRHAADRGVEVFYISNRNESNRSGTLKNLRRYGLPYADNDHLLLRTNTSNKDERRAAVLKDYEVIIYLGDNLGDFSHLFDSNSEAERKHALWKFKREIGSRFIVLPNPNYGNWEKAMNGGYPPLSVRDSILKHTLRSHK